MTSSTTPRIRRTIQLVFVTTTWEAPAGSCGTMIARRTGGRTRRPCPAIRILCLMLHGTARAWAVAPRARRAETVGCGRSTSTRPTNATSAKPAIAYGARDRRARVGPFGAGGGIKPRSAAQAAANAGASKAPVPSTSSAEVPSASASARSTSRSAAISLATASGTPRRFHSRRHSSTNGFTRPPPLRLIRARRRARRAPRAIRPLPRRAHGARRGKDGSTCAAARRRSRRDSSRRALRARDVRASG